MIGYTTGTYDLVHSGHYEILKRCKLRCRILIVGLVTDELGIRQKRKPVLSYQHRKTILENSKYVDAVIPFDGTTKQEDYLKIKFNILFISDEYYQADEYSSFERDYPGVPVIYFPRTLGISTSDIFKNIIFRVFDDTSVKSASINGDILSVEWKNNQNIIIKTIKVSSDDSQNTKNNYQLPMPPPRNWKMINCDKTKYPNITGVNPNREVKIFDIIKDKSWFPGFAIQNKKTENPDLSYLISDYLKLEQKIEYMNQKRKESKETYWLLQEDCGLTLHKYLTTCQNRDEIYHKIKEIIREIRDLNIIHGDLHAGNIMIKNEKVYIIDFGWCLHKSFDFEQDEKNYYNQLLDQNFDLVHFRESLVYDGLEKEIPEILT